jgi:hypothetical protein
MKVPYELENQINSQRNSDVHSRYAENPTEREHGGIGLSALLLLSMAATSHYGVGEMPEGSSEYRC